VARLSAHAPACAGAAAGAAADAAAGAAGVGGAAMREAVRAAREAAVAEEAERHLQREEALRHALLDAQAEPRQHCNPLPPRLQPRVAQAATRICDPERRYQWIRAAIPVCVCAPAGDPM